MSRQRIQIVGPRDTARLPGIVIDTTSRSPIWGHGLSPFFLGPCELPDGRISKNMENAWQYSKVYKTHLDSRGAPNQEWQVWSCYGLRKYKADRYPMGKGAVPEYSYWNGEKLDYIEARKQIYIPLYATAVTQTEAFSRLVELYRCGKQLTFWDFDGYPRSDKTWDEIIHDPKKKMGHAFVLAMLLENYITTRGEITPNMWKFREK